MDFSAWKTRIAWNVRQERWWWSAWCPTIGTELWGFVESKDQAFSAMTAAVIRHHECDTDPLGIPIYL